MFWNWRWFLQPMTPLGFDGTALGGARSARTLGNDHKRSTTLKGLHNQRLLPVRCGKPSV
jgi:hypothetical protein